MAGLKEIKTRIKSVKNTKKITYAMKLVSAAKLGKAQEAVKRSRDYTDGLKALLAELIAAQEGSDFSHPLVKEPDVEKKVKLVVIGANRGLAGAYNSRVNLAATEFIDEKLKNSVEVETILLGKKPAEFFRSQSLKYSVSYEELPDAPEQWPLNDICLQAEKEFLAGEIDALYVLYTRFKSALSQTVVVDKLLPMSATELESELGDEHKTSGLTLFEPSVKEVFAAVLPRIMRSRVQQSAQDAKASEHGSRMAAMDNATKNAGDLIDSLTLTHNKLRQSGITGEILDIVGGAEAAK